MIHEVSSKKKPKEEAILSSAVDHMGHICLRDDFLCGHIGSDRS